jgi:hypothetical protein
MLILCLIHNLEYKKIWGKRENTLDKRERRLLSYRDSTRGHRCRHCCPYEREGGGAAATTAASLSLHARAYLPP